MKKALKILSAALIVVLAIGLLVACGPSKDPAKAKKALEDAGYEVEAIIASNSDEEKEALDQMAQDSDLEAGDVEAMVAATKSEEAEDIGDFIYIYYFKDGDVANKFWDAHKEDLEKTVESYKEEIGKDVKYEKSGSIIYMGTEQAIKDAK